MANPYKRTVVWTDVAGQTTLRTLTSQAGASSVQTILVAQSNAVITEWWEQQETLPAGSPTPAANPFASQVAYLNFSDGAGGIARLALPAPLASIFLPDGVTVDPSQSWIAAIIAANEVVTPAGNLITTFMGGSLGKGTVNQA